MFIFDVIIPLGDTNLSIVRLTLILLPVDTYCDVMATIFMPTPQTVVSIIRRSAAHSIYRVNKTGTKR